MRERLSRHNVATFARSVAWSPVTFSIILALAVGAAIVAVTGQDPFLAYREMFTGAVDGSGLRNTLSRSIPIVGMALAVSVAFRARVINLGGEGQMVVGGLAGTVVAIYTPGPGAVVIPLALIAGAAAGALWALLPALGQTRLALPILITSLLLNYVGRAITGYLVRFPLADVSVTLATTRQVPETARMPKMPIFGGVSLSLILVILLVAGLWVAYSRSVVGYETQMAGYSGRFARYGGVPVERQTVGVMLVAGAIGGAIGTHLIIGDALRFIEGELVLSGLAWTGLLVSLLAANRPVFILIAGVLFSGLQIGGLAMQRNAEISWRLAQVLQSLVIIAVASRLSPTRWRPKAVPGSEAADELTAEPARMGEI
ncbi:MAG: ABC transporter permease [Acidimicrobiia bacterium]